MKNDYSWIKDEISDATWPEVLDRLLEYDIYEIRPFKNIREHPCLVPILELLRKTPDAVAILLGYLENFDVLGQWSLVFLPDLTGDNPVPESIRGKDELLLELYFWTRWAEEEGIEPIC